MTYHHDSKSNLETFCQFLPPHHVFTSKRRSCRVSDMVWINLFAHFSELVRIQFYFILYFIFCCTEPQAKFITYFSIFFNKPTYMSQTEIINFWPLNFRNLFGPKWKKHMVLLLSLVRLSSVGCLFYLVLRLCSDNDTKSLSLEELNHFEFL